AALPVAGVAQRFRLHAHQRLGEDLNHLPQQVRTCLLQLLLHPPDDVVVHTGPSGHRELLSRDPCSVLFEDHAVAVSAHDATPNDYAVVHHVWGLISLQGTWPPGNAAPSQRASVSLQAIRRADRPERAGRHELRFQRSAYWYGRHGL